MSEQTVTLEITGMTCDGCAQTIMRSLRQDRGVKEARIDRRAGTAVVTFDRNLTDEERILHNPVFAAQGLQKFTVRRTTPPACG